MLRWILLTKRIGNARKMLPKNWTSGAFSHVGLMATMENQQVFNRDWRKLAETPASWRGISCEPILGRIDISPWTSHNPLHENKAERDFRLSSGFDGRSGDYAGRNDLARSEANMGFWTRDSDQHPMQASKSGERLRGISSNSDDDRRKADMRVGASPCLPSFQGANSERPDGKSQGRSEEAEYSVKSGSRDLFGTADTRDQGLKKQSPRASNRFLEFDGKIDGTSGQGDPPQASGGRQVVGYSDGFFDIDSGGIKNSSWGEVGPLSWVITGGESGPNRRLLDMDAVRSLRDQCARNGIAFHHKQNGGLRGKDGGCLIDGREHKAFPPALAA